MALGDPEGDQIPVTPSHDPLGPGSVSKRHGAEVSQPDTVCPGSDEPAFLDNGRSKSVRRRHGAVQGTESTACIGIVHSATYGYARREAVGEGKAAGRAAEGRRCVTSLAKRVVLRGSAV
jgi:hypothetical protein